MTVVVTPLSGSEKLRLREVFASVQDSGSLSGYIRTYGFVRFSSPYSHREIRALILSPCSVLEPDVQLLHFWGSRHGTYCGRVHCFTSLSPVSE
ncbi:hypothetical protein PVK06_012122 [Gossypium arboreum]|uniref:RRM domain-containing protein n=1 Tax=Gossypium arboreum TaxID=29729 RepID=A0ABR0QAP9_GOSAR|nr:hypothetical protein PVK06_012122 [Gossypium arboreum]